jgi:oligopeptide transport system ATP-binding protein
MMEPAEPLLKINDLRKYYPVRSGLLRKSGEAVKAVDGVSLEVRPGETFGLVGESGCGKTTLGYCVTRLIEPTSGEIIFAGRNIPRLAPGSMRQLRREIQIIFQDPFSSLDPRMTVQQILQEPFIIHKQHSRKEQIKQVLGLLEAVGLEGTVTNKYPHEFSGGQRQRIGIARALALKPKLIVADEPVSALDVSIQAQIVNLLQHLQAKYRLTYLFISHSIPVVARVSNTIGVMYLGKLVELGASQEVCHQPLHPYTQILLASVPGLDPNRRREKMKLSGEVPSPVHPPAGCRFHTLCPSVMDRCKIDEPKPVQVSPTHKVWCHLIEEATKIDRH